MKNIYNSLYQPDVLIYSTKHRCWAETQKNCGAFITHSTPVLF